MSPSSNPSAPAREPSPSADENASHRSDGDVEAQESRAGSDAAAEKKEEGDGDAPPLPNESVPEGPPLPSEPTFSEPPLPNEPTPGDPPLPKETAPEGPPLPKEAPPQEDDGWDFQWDPNSQSYFFYNRFTGKTQWENPREPSSAPAAAGPQPPTNEKPAAGGYNPAIHGDYDPNAWYAQGNSEDVEGGDTTMAPGGLDPADPYASSARFNRFTGQFQTEDMGPGRHTDEAKSKRQMNAFFDVDAAANSHDGRSLKAERSNKKPSKQELKAFKEKRKARKEEKRRAWLRD